MMRAPAPLAVTVEIRALDVGERLDRVWRVAASVGDEGIRFERELPWEPDRPVSLTFRLPPTGDSPDDDGPLAVTGVVVTPDAVRFAPVDADTQHRLVRYVQERMQES